MDKLTISLTPDVARTVERAVAAGEYASTEEAVEQALREWSDRHDMLGCSAAELKLLIDDGIASGFTPHHSMDDIKAEGRQRLKSTGKTG